jgi:hypothetical protein
MLTRALLPAALALVFGGCTPPVVPINVDAYAGAEVVIEAGIDTPEVKAKAPFVGSFEGTSLGARAPYRLTFDLDAATARALGGSGPMKVHGLLWVNKPTSASRNVTLHLQPTDERLRALVRGEASEISAFVEDPAEGKRLALLVLRPGPR